MGCLKLLVIKMTILSYIFPKFWDVQRLFISDIKTPMLRNRCFSPCPKALQWITGWFKANLYTLTNNYGKLSASTEKIMVDLFSVYPDISFDNNNSDKITWISYQPHHNRNNRNNCYKLHLILKMSSLLSNTNFSSVSDI